MRCTRAALLLCLALIASRCDRAPAAPQSAALATASAQAVVEDADPVAAKLRLYHRLLAADPAPPPGRASVIASFLAANPDWPLSGTLARRRDEALAGEPDDGAVLALCAAAVPPVVVTAARLRCAAALAASGRTPDADAAIRAAWVEAPGDAAAEISFMQRYGATVRPEDQWARFVRLAWGDVAGATRQVGRVDAGMRPAAETWLAFKRDDATAPTLFAALPEGMRHEPGMVLDEVRWLRRAGRPAEAVALWRGEGEAAEAASPADRRPLFWPERNLLARDRLMAGDGQAAYDLAALPGAGVGRADSEFLAGFVALRVLGDAARAEGHFRTLADLSESAITRARAHFWLARAAAARSESQAAAAEYERASAWPSTFYGQLAWLARGAAADLPEAIRAARDPALDPPAALALAGQELARAAEHLVAGGEPRRSAGFLLRLAELRAAPGEQAAAARMAAGFGLPDIAVGIARRAGGAGIVLLQAGWPEAASVPPDAGVDPAVVLGLIRQESSFFADAVSPAGARGLMQLMPATATLVARRLGTIASPASLTADPETNMRLGTAYLRGLLDQFGGSVPIALAAYNAGPRRAGEWIAANGDPRTGVDAVDWIERIPITETRNYVQRVIESAVIYAAKRREAFAHPLTAAAR